MSILTHQSVPSLSAASSADVILHAFDWPYQKVTHEAKRIAQLGYDSVLISPPMKSPNFHEWWNRYQPQDYRIIDNPLGNTHDFRTMLETLDQYGIALYVDVVFNHMANESRFRKDLTYPNQETLNLYQAQSEHFEQLRLFGDLSKPLFTEQDFEPAFPITDKLDVVQVQTGRLTGSENDPGLPTLAPTDNVVKQQQTYLITLKKLGVKGFRIDAAKHLTANHIHKVWTGEICQDVKVFGEIITNGGAGKPEFETFLRPFLQQTNFDAYDFPLFHQLLNIFKYDGNMSSLLNLQPQEQCLDAKRAITFAVTHDIPNNDVFRDQILSPQHEALVYCYLLGCCDGTPLIYTDLNTSNDLDSLGFPRWEHSWYDNNLIKMVQFHKLVHGQPSQVLDCSEDVLIILRGTQENPAGIVAINKNMSEYKTKLSIENLTVWLGGDDLLLNQQLTIPANSGVMLLPVYTQVTSRCEFQQE